MEIAIGLAEFIKPIYCEILHRDECFQPLNSNGNTAGIEIHKYTVSSRLYAQSVSSEIRMIVGMVVVASHVLH